MQAKTCPRVWAHLAEAGSVTGLAGRDLYSPSHGKTGPVKLSKDDVAGPASILFAGDHDRPR